MADVFNSEIRKIDSNGMVTTLAGKSGVYGSKNGNGTNVTFAHNSPQAVTVDGSGGVYVADTYNDIVRKIDSNGLVTTLAGKSGVKGGNDGIGTNATFDEPAGVVADGNGNVYVADNSTIRKIDSNGVVTTLAGKYPGYKTLNGTGSSAGFDGPSGITLDASGNIYVAEYVGNTIRKGSLGTNIVQTIKFEAIPKKVYGAPSFTLTATATSGLPITYISSKTNVATVFSNTVTIVGAGTTTITATQTGSPNFKGATPVKRILTVAQATQAIIFGAIPAHSYGDASFPLTAIVSPSTNQTVTFTSSKTNVATVSGNTLTIVGAGETTITASVTAPNYTPATTSRVLIVNKAAQTISFSTPSSEVFVKGSTFTLTATAPGGTVSFKSSNPKVISITGTTATIQATGKATITASCPASANYKGSTPVAIAVTVQ